MWLFLLILFGLGGCSFIIILVFGLIRAGRRADEWEERILTIISPESPDNTTATENTATDGKHTSSPISTNT